jgi:DNA-binding NtrC family response regulator
MKLEAPTQQFQSPYVMVVFPSHEHRTSLLKAVAHAGMVPMHCETLEEAREAMKSENIQAVICEDLLPEAALDAILKQARNRTRPIAVIITSRTGEWGEFLKALRQGAFDYLVLPPRLDEVSRVLGLAIVEGARTDADETKSGEAPISEVNPLVYRSEDRWGVRFSNTAPILSRPQILRGHIRETK